MRELSLLLVLTCAAAPVRAEDKKTRAVLVLDIKSDVVDPATARTITGTVAASVSKRPRLNVLTSDDVKRMAEVEADKQMLGCDPSATSCLAEIAGAMGADLVCYGDVGKLGDLYVVNLNLFDAGQAKALGRKSVYSKTFDDSFIAQLEATVRDLFMPVTGETPSLSSGSVGSAAVPTIDLQALRAGGLKAINIEAEKALEAAMDAQESSTASPQQKRDAWCKLAEVSGANPYFAPASKACSEWATYVAANEDLTKSLAADYATLGGFLELKRKTKEQKLEAVDQFLKTYSRLSDRQEVKAVDVARKELERSGAATLPTDRDGDGFLIDKCPDEPEDFDGDDDDDGCPEVSVGERLSGAASETARVAGDVTESITFLPFAFDKDPYFGLSMTGVTHLDSSIKPTTPLAGFGMRFAWAPLELGYSFYSDFGDVVMFGGYAGLQLLEIPNKDFALLRPSAGIEVMNFPALRDGSEQLLGAYVANTFRIFFAQIRLQYRYAFSGNLLPQHSLGAELSMDIVKLFE